MREQILRAATKAGIEVATSGKIVGLDSMSIVDFALALEAETGVEISGDDLDDGVFDSVDATMAFLTKLRDDGATGST
jgi:acyl carrier protein